MDGTTIMTYLKRLCSAIDEDSAVERFQWRRAVAPVTMPVILGGALLAGGCPQAGPEPVDMYGAPYSLSEVCGDGVDNDGDGRIDCSDDECATDPSCVGVPAYGVPLAHEDCTDGQDNNNNGLVDCEDPLCATQPPCATPASPPLTPTPTLYGTPALEVCDDNIDNDNDGAMDCADTDCSALPICAPAVGAYGAPPIDNSMQRYQAPFPHDRY